MAVVKVTRREFHLTAHTYEELRTTINLVLALAERNGVSPGALQVITNAAEDHMVIAYDEPAEDIHV